MHASDTPRSWIDDLLRGIDAAAENLDRAIDALSDAAAPGRAYELTARPPR